MTGKTIQVYFKGFIDNQFKLSTEHMRSIVIKGTIEYMKNTDAFIHMVVSTNSFDIKHYDKVKNIVTFLDDTKKKGIILPFITDDMNYDADIAFCFLATKTSILNSHGKLIPVKYVIPIEQSVFKEHFHEIEKEMLPVDFLESVRKMYKKQPLQVNDVESIEKYIDDDSLSTTMIHDLVNSPSNENETIKQMRSMLQVMDKKLEAMENDRCSRKYEEQPIQVLQQTKA
jgi:hypothetical protein